MANIPLPAPPLDGVPPSPPSLQAGGGSNPPLTMASPGEAMGGNMQIVQLGLETAAAVAKGLDLLGQIFPAFMPTAAMLQQQLRSGFKSALQQGVQASEPSAQASQTGMGMMMQPPAGMPGGVQQPLPPLNSGLGL